MGHASGVYEKNDSGKMSIIRLYWVVKNGREGLCGRPVLVVHLLNSSPESFT